MTRAEKKVARRRQRKKKGRVTDGTRRRREKEAVRAKDAWRLNDELLAARRKQSKRYDDAHDERRKMLAKAVGRKPRWNPGTPNKRPPQGVTGVGAGSPHR